MPKRLYVINAAFDFCLLISRIIEKNCSILEKTGLRSLNQGCYVISKILIYFLCTWIRAQNLGFYFGRYPTLAVLLECPSLFQILFFNVRIPVLTMKYQCDADICTTTILLYSVKLINEYLGGKKSTCASYAAAQIGQLCLH